MPSDKPPPRWARELDEEDLRRMREKGPGGITYIPVEDGPGVARYLVFTIAVGAMGFLLGFASRAVYDLALSVL